MMEKGRGIHRRKTTLESHHPRSRQECGPDKVCILVVKHQSIAKRQTLEHGQIGQLNLGGSGRHQAEAPRNLVTDGVGN